MKDRDVITTFVAYLQTKGHPDLRVEEWPEDVNRDSLEIDAIAGPFAIEHTSIDTLPNQRRDSDWFTQVVGGLEKELSGSITFRLNVTLEYEAVKKGQNWSAIQNALKAWLTMDAPQLEDGKHILDHIPGVPFHLRIVKSSARPAGLFFSRYDRGDDTLSDRTRELLVRKAEKLQRYQSSGKTTLLLVESDDIALMNESKMFEAVRIAFDGGLPPGVDQLWYADTSIPSEILFTDFTPAVK
ncbi:MAG: hypothetical protein MUC41_18015 [Syntrophobacteraceae bacterium]|nr:hypothetical protein [Syntrophobacteraceae bacterium]